MGGMGGMPPNELILAPLRGLVGLLVSGWGVINPSSKTMNVVSARARARAQLHFYAWIGCPSIEHRAASSFVL
eukprot:NODE_10572_length_331_cov_14.709220_g9660_i0.p1 GENE.NODE_10572_length_331_cov_14.709220_g9660_i0~~NODE_10572_length_331_cov_14.709220_g9660_i0.p1  ORF type:complete len:73 (+),score=0.95 NODE_10572_length_331_cov_14.709220_g9660_i0:101-319(+)